MNSDEWHKFGEGLQGCGCALILIVFIAVPALVFLIQACR